MCKSYTLLHLVLVLSYLLNVQVVSKSNELRQNSSFNETKYISRNLWTAYLPEAELISKKTTSDIKERALCDEQYPDAEKPKLISNISNDEMNNKYKLWSGVMSKYDYEKGKVLYGMYEGLEAIWSNQNPENCSNAKFMLAENFQQGFGSEMHVSGQYLAIALTLGRVLIQDPNDKERVWRYQNPLCDKQNKRTLECYYEPWSKCTIADVFTNLRDSGQMQSRATPIPDVHTRHLATPYGAVHIIKYDESTVQTSSTPTPTNGIILKPKYDDDVVVSMDYNGLFIDDPNNKAKYIPPIFDRLLECSPLKPDLYYFWWRTMSVTYLLRPNAPTLQLLDEVADPVIRKSGGRCIATYVRHGDKGSEMTLVPFSRYQQTAMAIWNARLTDLVYDDAATISEGNPKVDSSRIFWLGTEDPGVLPEGIAWGKKANVNVLYHRYQDAMFDAKRKTPHEWTYFSYLMNLAESLRCEVTICTYQSNYCRILDELRATIGAKANRYTADVNFVLCSGDKPCISSDSSVFNTKTLVSKIIW